MFKEIVTVCLKIIQNRNTLCAQNAELLNFKTGGMGAYIYYTTDFKMLILPMP